MALSCVTGMKCVRCGSDVAPPVSAGTCPACDDPFAVLEVQFDLDRARRTLTPDALAQRPLSHWRYRELLPLDIDDLPAPVPTWPVGWTSLLDAPRLAAWAGVRALRLKDEGRNPTGSFKDRASSVGVAHALSRGAERVACASTGNAASSLAGFAAMAGIPATIYVPRAAPDPKVAQLLIYGADVCRVRGSYAQAYDMCAQACGEHGWYNRNCATNPYVIEGKKTCGLELAEQMGVRVADWVVVSVGDGCTIAGIGRGLRQMHALGFIDRLPRLLGVQAHGVRPILDAFSTGALPDPSSCTGTMADSIDVPVPRNWRKAVREVRASGGGFVSVTDEEIGEAMRRTGALAGTFAEPAAAASVAGLRRAVLDSVIGSGEDVIVVVTGNGLKDIRSAMLVAGAAREVDPPAHGGGTGGT